MHALTPKKLLWVLHQLCGESFERVQSWPTLIRTLNVVGESDGSSGWSRLMNDTLERADRIGEEEVLQLLQHEECIRCFKEDKVLLRDFIKALTTIPKDKPQRYHDPLKQYACPFFKLLCSEKFSVYLAALSRMPNFWDLFNGEEEGVFEERVRVFSVVFPEDDRKYANQSVFSRLMYTYSDLAFFSAWINQGGFVNRLVSDPMLIQRCFHSLSKVCGDGSIGNEKMSSFQGLLTGRQFALDTLGSLLQHKAIISVICADDSLRDCLIQEMLVATRKINGVERQLAGWHRLLQDFDGGIDIVLNFLQHPKFVLAVCENNAFQAVLTQHKDKIAARLNQLAQTDPERFRPLMTHLSLMAPFCQLISPMLQSITRVDKSTQTDFFDSSTVTPQTTVSTGPKKRGHEGDNDDKANDAQRRKLAPHS